MISAKESTELTDTRRPRKGPVIGPVVGNIYSRSAMSTPFKSPAIGAKRFDANMREANSIVSKRDSCTAAPVKRRGIAQEAGEYDT